MALLDGLQAWHCSHQFLAAAPGMRPARPTARGWVLLAAIGDIRRFDGATRFRFLLMTRAAQLPRFSR